jgi:hypothetical protein
LEHLIHTSRDTDTPFDVGVASIVLLPNGKATEDAFADNTPSALEG